MVNTRTKMYTTNSHIRKFLIAQGFKNFYNFPHSRFLKDYHLEGQGFDALAWRDGEKNISLFQFKSNLKPSKSTLEEYSKIENKYSVKCYWVTKFDRKNVEIFPPLLPMELSSSSEINLISSGKLK